MGQKSNPIALRTRQKGRFFDSSWYNDIDYGKAISRDQMIEKYLGSVTKNMRNQNSRFYIQEVSKKYILTLFYFKAQETRKKRSKPLSLRKRRSKRNHPKIGYYINTMGYKSTICRALTNRRKSIGLLAKKNRGINNKLKIWHDNSSICRSSANSNGVETPFYKNNRNKYSVYLRQKKTEKLNITKIPETAFTFTPILQNFGVFWSRKSLFNVYENQSPTNQPFGSEATATGTVIGGTSPKQSLKNNQNIANFFYKRLEKNNKSSFPQGGLADKSTICPPSNKSKIYKPNRRLVKETIKKNRAERSKNGKGISLPALQSCFIKKYKKDSFLNKNGGKKYNNQYSILHNYYNGGLRGPFTNLLTTINTQSHILLLQKPTLKQRYQQLQSFGVFQAILSSGNKGRYHQMIKPPSYLYINRNGEYFKNKKVCEINKDGLYNLPGIKHLTNGGPYFTPYSNKYKIYGKPPSNKSSIYKLNHRFMGEIFDLWGGSSFFINKQLYTHYLYNHYAKLYTNYKLYQGYKYKKFDIGTKKKRGSGYAVKSKIYSGIKYFYNQKFANQRKRMRKMFAKTYFKDLVKKKYKQHISNILSDIVKSNVILRVRHLKSDYLSANSLAEEIAYYMKRGSRFGQIKNRIIQELDQGLISPKIIGIRISCSGRIGGRSKKALRSRTLGLRNGSVPLNNFTRKIDYCYKKARTRYGIVGIKVWLSYR